MSLLLLLAKWWDSHGTGILGTASSIAAGLVLIPDLIPVEHRPYWAAVNLVLGAMTVRRSNTNRQKLANEP